MLIGLQPSERICAVCPMNHWQRCLRTKRSSGVTFETPRVWYDPRFDCTSLWEDVTINMDMFGYVWGKLFAEIDVTHGLEQFDRPVFLALGRYDFIVAPPASWDDVKSKFKNLTIRIFERSGHTPQFEEPELFDPELLSWMHQHAV
jgi:proline iminopeptidase